MRAETFHLGWLADHGVDQGEIVAAAARAALNCSDVPPKGPEGFTCVQQRFWKKCTEPWMAGKCCRTCHSCVIGCGGDS